MCRESAGRVTAQGTGTIRRSARRGRDRAGRPDRPERRDRGPLPPGAAGAPGSRARPRVARPARHARHDAGRSSGAGRESARRPAGRGAALPATYRAVVEAGLRSGRLSAALEDLAAYARNFAELRQAVGLALLYPMLVLLLAWACWSDSSARSCRRWSRPSTASASRRRSRSTRPSGSARRPGRGPRSARRSPWWCC